MEPENGPHGRGDSYWKSSFSVNLSGVYGLKILHRRVHDRSKLHRYYVVVDPSQVQYTIGKTSKTNVQAEKRTPLEIVIFHGTFRRTCHRTSHMINAEFWILGVVQFLQLVLYIDNILDGIYYICMSAYMYLH